MNYLKLRSLVLLIALVISTIVAFADNNYKVISASRLNVRKAPSTGAVIGSLVSGQEIEVVSIDKGWAKVKYKNGYGYVSAKYIAPLLTKTNTNSQLNNIKQPTSNGYSFEKVNTGFVVEKNNNHNQTLFNYADIYLSGQAGVGFSSFTWNNGNVNGTLAYSLDVLIQLYFTKQLNIIPENWYSEVALGYEKKGAAKFDMSYIRTQICPFGYKIPVDPFNIIVKGGMALSYPLNDLNKRWKANLQLGAIVGAHVDWEQFSFGCNLSYDISKVSYDCGQKLNNIAAFCTISYKFEKINDI